MEESLRETTSYIPLLAVVLMYTGFGLGYGPIVFMLQGNVVPSSVSVNPTKIQLVFKTGVKH